MAKTALKEKAAGKQKFAVRAYTSSACAGFACGRWPIVASSPVSPSPAGKHYVVGPKGKPRRGRAIAQCQ